MPFEPGDPLANLGLEESGSSQESAWSGADEWPVADDERAERAEREVGNRTGSSQWDTPDNPYKTRFEELDKKVKAQSPTVANRLQAELAQNQQWAAEAYDAVVNNPDPNQRWHPQVARQFIETKLGELNTRAELEATREAALPHVRRGSADTIAAEFSDKKAGVTINADELLSEMSMDGMRARAKALADSRRDKMVATRHTNGNDRVEGGPPANGRRQLPDDVSPELRIKYGLERGHL